MVFPVGSPFSFSSVNENSSMMNIPRVTKWGTFAMESHWLVKLWAVVDVRKV